MALKRPSKRKMPRAVTGGPAIYIYGVTRLDMALLAMTTWGAK